jgi:hypothetical protein
VSDKHLFFALTNAAEGRDEDFNAWYDTYHLKEVVANCPGFVAGQRYKLNPLQRTGQGAGRPSPWGYIAIYEIEGDDLPAIHEAVKDFVKERGFTSHAGTLDPTHEAWVYTPTGSEATGGQSLGADRHVFLALTNAAEGREADLDRWYDEHHLAEIVSKFPGFVTGQRSVAEPGNQRPGESPPWRNLALYELEGDLEEIHRRDAEVRLSGELVPHDGALDPDYAVWVYTPTGRRATRAELESAAVAS